MSTITLPTPQEVQRIVNREVGAPRDVGFAIGVASPQLEAPGFYFVGRLLDYRKQPLEQHPNTPFELASNSKIFTAALLAYYAQQNPDLLTAAVSSYTPPGLQSLPDSFSSITLLDLADYTSGLPQDNINATDEPIYVPQPYTAASMYGFLHDGNVPVTGPGTTFTYSNLAVSLLACTIPVAVQSSLGFGELLQQTITGPLGMNDTKVFADVSVTELPLGMSEGQPQSSGWYGFPAYTGGGGMVSTAHDMMIWLQFHMGMLASSLNGILPLMQKPATTVTYEGIQLGMGWFIGSIPAEDDGQPISLPVLWKDGGITGCSTYVCFLQSTAPGTAPSQAGVFVLTNGTLTNDGQAIAQAVLRHMNGYA